MASARAKGLVALCKQGTVSVSENCTTSSPEISQKTDDFSSPLSSWWDDVYDASDVKSHMCNIRRPIDVKRKLTFSPARVPTAINDCGTKATSSPPSLPKAKEVLKAETDWGRIDKQHVSPSHKVRAPEASISSVQGTFTPLPSYDQDTNSQPVKDFDQLDSSCSQISPSQRGGAHKDCHANTQVESIPLFSKKEADIPSNSVIDLGPMDASSNHVSHSQKGAVPLYPSQLKIYEASRALNSGKEHVNTVGKLRKARALRTPCKVECKRCSSPRLTEEERSALFKEFWDLQNHEKQWLYLYKIIELSMPKRKFSAKGAKGEKSVNREYYFSVNKRKVKVCKTMFKNTLSICDSWINNALSHCIDGIVSIQDKRGKCKSVIKTKIC